MNNELILQKYEELKAIKEVIDSQTKKGENIELNTVIIYESFLKKSQEILPNLLNDFSINRLLIIDNSSPFDIGNFKYYPSTPLKISIGMNLAILKAKLSLEIKETAVESKDFSFIKNADIRLILERDYKDIHKNLLLGSWKSAIILSGGSIEALLLDTLQENKPSALNSQKAPTYKSKKNRIEKWDLSELIDVAADLKLVNLGASKLSHSLREYRNLVHPGVELKSSLKVEPEEAKIAFEILNLVIRDLNSK